MKVAALFSRTSGRVPFHRSELVRAPLQPGCYALAGVEDDVVYVGQTENLQRRMKEHLDDRRMNAQTPFGLPVWFYYMLLPDEHLVQWETQLLVRFKAIEGRLPSLNRAGP